jgi:hypothetical protein
MICHKIIKFHNFKNYIYGDAWNFGSFFYVVNLLKILKKSKVSILVSEMTDNYQKITDSQDISPPIELPTSKCTSMLIAFQKK